MEMREVFKDTNVLIYMTKKICKYHHIFQSMAFACRVLKLLKINWSQNEEI